MPATTDMANTVIAGKARSYRGIHTTAGSRGRGAASGQEVQEAAAKRNPVPQKFK